ncbi:MAG: hypothetical protein J7M34_03780 [Anaerolineae bacterium]|nr:hypothetical protein [Anaerolineae bacterium]
MNLARTLYTLQTIELDLAAKSKRVQEIQSSLGETQALRSARTALEQAEAELNRWRVRQRDLELEVRSLEQHIRDAERQLMSGRVRNPKELEGMQANVQSLRRRQEQLEDELLEAMVNVDEQTSHRDEVRARYEQTEAQWRGEQERLRTEVEELRQLITQLTEQREHIRAQLDADVLFEYDHLRQRRGGYAVSEVKGESCGVCGVTLPTSLVQAARRGEELVHCSSCGRILYAR